MRLLKTRLWKGCKPQTSSSQARNSQLACRSNRNQFLCRQATSSSLRIIRRSSTSLTLLVNSLRRLGLKIHMGSNSNYRRHRASHSSATNESRVSILIASHQFCFQVPKPRSLIFNTNTCMQKSQEGQIAFKRSGMRSVIRSRDIPTKVSQSKNGILAASSPTDNLDYLRQQSNIHRASTASNFRRNYNPM